MRDKIKSILPEYALLSAVGNGAPQSPRLIRSEFVSEGACAAAIQPKDVYADLRLLSEEELRGALGKCRFVAGSPEELRLLNSISAANPLEGQLPSVGLRLIPTAYDDGNLIGIKEADLPALSAEIRQLCAISVRGCFIDGSIHGLHGKELGRYFRNCYELSKRMTVILPCAMPYIGIVHGVDAVAYNLQHHPETLEEFRRAAAVVAMQNNTAFYAELLLI